MHRPVDATLPITFHNCLFTAPARATPTLFRYDNNATDCGSGGTETAIPGGFGWLTQNRGWLQRDGQHRGPHRHFEPREQLPERMQRRRPAATDGNPVILIPVYDTASGTGAGGSFHIVGFAALKITGYNFSENRWNNNARGRPSCTGNCRGIIGTFVTLVNLDNSYTMGTPTSG